MKLFSRLAPLFAAICCICFPAIAKADFPDRFVWIFGWGLGKDSDVPEITKVLESADQHGFNGAVLSTGMDSLCQQSPDYFRRLEQIQKACEQYHLELIPAVFSIGYGGGILAHNRNLAEGVPVEDAPFVVKGKEAVLAPVNAQILTNGDFENFKGNQFKAFNFHDQPGEISFVDTLVRHRGSASIRLENFAANPHGHARVMQSVKLQPHRCYRMTLWVKTDGLQPAGAFRMLALAGDRELAPREFKLPATTDWRKVSMLFNSLDVEKVNVYAGLWGAKSGKVWIDDWTLEEFGPANVLRRPGTPVTVRSEDAKVTYVEGSDYAPLQVANFSPWREDAEPTPLKLLPGSRIHDGDRLRVSWYHSMLVHDSQITLCMAEPQLYEFMDHEAKLLAERLHPRKIFLNADEIRMGGTCAACRGHDMGELLGECITKQTQLIHRYLPGAQIYIWSDMLDPNHNAHGNYYLVRGDYKGSWEHIPKDLVIAVWGGTPREKSLRFFPAQGFRTLVACYYDADDLRDTRTWLDLGRTIPNLQGFMYTPWQKKYGLLPEFGDLIKTGR